MSAEAPSASAAHPSGSHKSYKRKYRKLRHQFKEAMSHSDHLFSQDQLATLAIRRLNEENTRLLDLLLDLNTSTRLPPSRHHNIGTPTRSSPPRFLPPETLALLSPNSLALLDPNHEPPPPTAQNSDTSSDDDPSDDDEATSTSTPAQNTRASLSDDDDADDKEAYQEEIREWNFRRGIAGTPPRSIREKMRAEAERERKDAQEAARCAALQPEIKNEEEDDAEQVEKQEEEKKVFITEEYRRGHTPDHLKDPTPFLMTLEEEDAYFRECEQYPSLIPPVPYPPAEGKADADPRNPMSVYCWLRKNQPGVFLQNRDGEEQGERKARGRGGGRRKVEHESGDERRREGKRRRGEEGESPSSRRKAGRGGRAKKEGEPPLKRQRSVLE